MATIVNNPPAVESSSNGAGMIFGLIVLLLLIAAFIFYGIPYLSSVGQTETPSVIVPDKVDVNVNTPDSSGN